MQACYSKMAALLQASLSGHVAAAVAAPAKLGISLQLLATLAMFLLTKQKQ